MINRGRAHLLGWIPSSVLLALALTACSGEDAGAEPDAENEPESASVSEVTIAGSVTVEPLDHPLLADLVIELDEPSVPVVRLVGPDGERELSGPADAATEHTVLIAGVRADTEYTIEVDVLDAAGSAVGVLDPTTFTSGSLPDHLPEFRVPVADADRMADGLTVFNLLDLRDDFDAGEDDADDESGAGEDSTAADTVPPPAGWIFMVDGEGEVVWYHVEDHPVGEVTLLGDATILFEFNDTAARRIDLRGEVLEEWASTTIVDRLKFDAFGRQVVGDTPVVVDVDAMHHEHRILPDGSHATLSTELRVLDGFDEPQCGEDPATFDGTYHLVGDVVVLFDPATGEVLQEINLFDHLDPRADPAAYNLCGLPFDFVFPNWLYRGLDDEARDWTHANAIELDEPNNTLIVSVRHLDALLGFRWLDDADGPAGELLWHSGPLGDLELVSGVWHRHQHAPEVQADGTVLVYDNGNNRPGHGTDDNPLYTRAVLYDIDPDAGTIDQLWEYRSTDADGAGVYASAVGDADRLANGNVLMVDGFLPTGDTQPVSAQIVEIVPNADADAGGEAVFRLEVADGPGWLIYRADRVPSPF